MKPIERRIWLDVAAPGRQAAIYARQGDVRVYALVISLCERSEPLRLAEGMRVALRAQKPDGTVLFEDGRIEQGRALCYLSTQALIVSGVVHCELDIYGVNGEALFSPCFDIYIEPHTVDDSEIESASEFSALTAAMSELQQTEASVRDAEALRAEAEEAREEAQKKRNAAIDGMTVSGEMLTHGEPVSVTISDVEEKKHIHFAIPMAKGYTILGSVYDSVEMLAENITNPNEGDQYNVGSVPPYHVYRWTGSAWEDQGCLYDAGYSINSVNPVDGAFIITAEDMPQSAGSDTTVAEALEERLKKSEVYNGLDQEGAGYALDARQGRALREELTEKAASLGQRIETKASTARYGAILTADGWSAAAPYEQTAAVSGILSTDDPFVDVDMSGAESAEGGTALTEAWTLVGRVTANEGSVTAYCYEDKPEVNIPLILKVVR